MVVNCYVCCRIALFGMVFFYMYNGLQFCIPNVHVNLLGFVWFSICNNYVLVNGVGVAQCCVLRWLFRSFGFWSLICCAAWMRLAMCFAFLIWLAFAFSWSCSHWVRLALFFCFLDLVGFRIFWSNFHCVLVLLCGVVSLLCSFACFYLLVCNRSTGLPGGNQVDGLLPAWCFCMVFA